MRSSSSPYVKVKVRKKQVEENKVDAFEMEEKWKTLRYQ
jgi:hypothetical protein